MERFPAFSWSHSRDRLLLDCTRAYYWRYYGAHDGWRDDALPVQRLAYALKHLTTLPLVLGTAIHGCARENVLAIRRGAPRPSFDLMLAQVADALNRAVLGAHHRAAFRRDPRRVVMTLDAWYGRRRGGSGLAEALAKARRCLRLLVEAPVWSDLEGCRPEWIAVADSPEPFVHDGWPVYAAPDVVYRPEGRRVVIVDWKTGDETEAELQLALYALYCRKALGIPFRQGEWFGRIVNLGTGEDTTGEIGRTHLQDAADRIADSVRAMHSLLTSVELNQPKPREAFPLVAPARDSICLTCPFFALCEEELAERRQTSL